MTHSEMNCYRNLAIHPALPVSLLNSVAFCQNQNWPEFQEFSGLFSKIFCQFQKFPQGSRSPYTNAL
ncbi:MAG: hypothetical protein FWH22_07350, partial [Fibromonadales bacterium]|nr:hypothetical protein [Fibromonadales bacterium]